MNINILLDTLLNLLQKNSATKKYFESTINFFNEKIELWNNSFIRIGLIGITSTGKSTFINALFGEEILHVGTKPTSGILVTCSKSENSEFEVFFYDKDKIHFEGSEVNLELTKQYASESENPQNLKNVKHIDLRKPSFEFEKNIQIVDSPGLNAYGYDLHEKITWSNLLPTIDMCLLFTNITCSAHQENYDILEKIVHHQKPVIIIQNMIDSLRPDKGKNGTITNTVENKALKCRNDVENVIVKYKNKANIISIVQMSAQQALNGKINNSEEESKKSNYKELINLIKNNYEIILKNSSQNRFKAIKNELDRIIRDFNEDDVTEKNEIYKKTKNELINYNNKRDFIESFLSKTLNLINDIITNQFNESTKKINNNLQNLNKYNIQAAVELLNSAYKKDIEKIESKIFNCIEEFDNEINFFLKQLNLNIREIISFDEKFDNIKFEIKTDKYVVEEKVKKQGFFNSVIRCIPFTDWGYEIKYTDKEIINLNSTISDVNNKINKRTKQLKRALEQWNKINLDLIEKIRSELLRRQNDIENKKTAESDIDIELLKDIFIELKKINNDIKIDSIINIKNEIIQIKRKKILKTKISTFQYNYLTVANKRYYKIFEHIFQHSQRINNLKVNKNSLILFWNKNEANIFYSRFLNNFYNKKWMNEIENNQFYKIYFQNKNIYFLDGNKTLVNTNNIIFDNVYLLVNTVQYGNTKKKLDDSEILKKLTNTKCAFNWVCTSFTEHINSNSIEDGIQSFFDLTASFKNTDKGYLINHNNPIYSLIIFQLLSMKEIKQIDEIKIIKKYQSNYGYLLNNINEENNLGKFIKTFSNLCKKVII